MGLRFLTAGESHGPALTAILDGLPAGLLLDSATINLELARRQQGYGAGPRMKIERDQARILSGVMEGCTTGAPVALYVDNLDHAKWSGRAVPPFTVPRPGHADLTGVIKYGYDDLRPALERASARETAGRVAVGAVCKLLLAQFGVQVGGYVTAIGEVRADLEGMPYAWRIEQAEASPVRCPDPVASERMVERIQAIMQSRDTLGGVLEIAALGLPPGLGSYVQWDRRLDARLGACVLSVPAMKGVEIGPAFENAALPGTQVQDAIFLEGEALVRQTGRSGGLEGGITTGEPLVVRAAMKPIATTLTPQRSVELDGSLPPGAPRGVDTNYERSDFGLVPRAVPILEAMIAYVLADALIEKLGGDSLGEMLPRCAALRRARLPDVLLRGGTEGLVFWPEEG